MTLADATSTLHSSPGKAHPLRAGDTLPADVFASIRRRMVLDCCKWDPQVGDIATLAPFPLMIRRARWNELAGMAEALAAETTAAERELLVRPELHRALALPRPIRAALRNIGRLGETPAAVRVMRFDFHWTTEGWLISEVNSDVPGGYAESSAFPILMAQFFDNAEPAGNPGSAWAAAMIASASCGGLAMSAPNGPVVFLSAPGFMEDQQVVAYLAKVLAACGVETRLARPEQIEWKDGYASLAGSGPLSAIVRFYQAEWLANLPRRHWRPFFSGARSPVVNPGAAVLTESKRFPLAWHALTTPMKAWRRLLPETRDPREAPWRRDEGWLLKTAFCNTGDTVISRRWATQKQWNATCWSVWLRPRQWIAQRCFDAIPLDTPIGAVFPCIGVYTINGRAAGAYARLAHGPVVNYQAIDAALLVEKEAGQSTGPCLRPEVFT